MRLTDRHIFALANPCYEAEETSDPKFADMPIHPVGRILTVNSGFE